MEKVVKPTYSHSKLSTFEQCRLKYKFRYIDKIIPEIEKSIEAHLGSCVHETLEWLYKTILATKRQKIPTLDETIVYYSECWQKNFTQDIVIVRKDMTANNYYNKGIKFLLDYYLQHQPFDDNTLEIEKLITLEIGEEGHKIKGFIDRLAHNLATDELEIHDYKTANTLPAQEKFETDRQLALYSIAIKEIFGQEKRVKLIWHYLNHNKKIISERTDEQLEKLKAETIALIKEIESTTTFPANKTILCDWCEYKNICPAWGNSENKTIKNADDRKDALSKYPTLAKYLKD